MTLVNIHEAKTQFSKLINRVLQGEEIIIARSGKPVAKLVSAGPEKSGRVPGSAAGLIQMSDDFNAPLPDEILAEFEL